MSKFTQEEKTNIVLENILNRKSVRHYLEGKKSLMPKYKHY